jgi:hypothetical protein
VQRDRVWKNNGRTERERRAVLMCQPIVAVFAIQLPFVGGFDLMLVCMTAMMGMDRACDG